MAHVLPQITWDAALSPLSPRNDNIPAFDFEKVLNDASSSSVAGPSRQSSNRRRRDRCAAHPFSRSSTSAVVEVLEEEEEEGSTASGAFKPFRKPWTLLEDDAVRNAVATHGLRAWSYVAALVPGRTGKQCRERWYNHLDAAVRKEPWGVDEECKLVQLQGHLGNRCAQRRATRRDPLSLAHTLSLLTLPLLLAATILGCRTADPIPTPHARRLQVGGHCQIPARPHR